MRVFYGDEMRSSVPEFPRRAPARHTAPTARTGRGGGGERPAALARARGGRGRMEGGARGVAQRAWAAEAQRLAAQAARLGGVRSALSADNPCRAVERETLRRSTRLALARELGSRADAARRGVAALGDLMEAASAGGDGAAALLASSLARWTTTGRSWRSRSLALQVRGAAQGGGRHRGRTRAFEQRRARWETESAAAGVSPRGPGTPMVSRGGSRLGW